VAVAAIRQRNLFAAVMLFGIYSLLMAVLFVTMDAVDVAFTEAAVGAGIATILMLATLAITSARQKPSSKRALAPLLAAVATGVVLAYGTLDLPRFADPQAPAHRHVAPRYLTQSAEEIGIPNVVTSVLASYRGYDTLGEVTVIFTAGIGVLVLIGRTRRSRRRPRDDGG
jgi:multicomponent Na+:H+ antiporter subunit B